MKIKIISGGQTGADQGGLEAGKELGLETGGTAPQKFMTELGTCLKLRDTYGLKEGEYDPKTYPKRTELNVKNSDGTLWFGTASNSPGFLCTIHAAEKHRKPVHINPGFENLRRWLEDNSIQILNVAGNRESRNYGIQERVRNFLVDALRER